MDNPPILLRGGTILQHDSNDGVEILHDTDLLIQDGRIHQIGKSINVDASTRVMDCTDKIISPGFVDTHHHVWQTQLKGRHSDDTLFDYHPKGNLQFHNYTPEDVFWGELGGLMEAIHGGTTTIVDHAHMSRSPDHVFAAVSATIASGIRSVFCYTLVPHIKNWDASTFQPESNPIPSWFFETFERLADLLKSTSGKINLGFAVDNYFLPQDVLTKLFKTARGFGAKVITSHWRRNNMAADDSFSIPNILSKYQLLGADILLSHATGSTDEEFRLLTEAGAYISSTPATESQMAHGDIVCFRKGVLGSLGADCHSNNPGSILHAVQIGLAVVRSQRNANIISQGKFPRAIEPTTLHGFNLATIYGARACGLEDDIGSLREGKQADIVIFRTDTPSMVCGAEEDPIAAVVRHASPEDIDTVIVGGRILKEGGALKDALLNPSSGQVAAWQGWKGSELKDTIAIPWSKVCKELRRSRSELGSRIHSCTIHGARQAVKKIWGMPPEEQLLM